MEKYHKRRYVTFHLLLMSSIVCCCWRGNRVGGMSILCLGAVITLLVLTEHSLFCWKKYYQNIIVKEATKFSRILVTAPDHFCHYQGDSSASFAWFVWSEWVREGGREGGGVYWAENGWNITFEWKQCCQYVNVRIGRVFFTFLW